MTSPIHDKNFLFLPIKLMKLVDADKKNSKPETARPVTFIAQKKGNSNDPRFLADTFYVSIYNANFIDDFDAFSKRLEQQPYELFIDGYWKKIIDEKGAESHIFNSSAYLTIDAYRENGIRDGVPIHQNGQFIREILKNGSISFKTSANIAFPALKLTDSEINGLFLRAAQPSSLIYEFVKDPSKFNSINEFKNIERFKMLKSRLSNFEIYGIIHQYSYLRLLGLNEGASISLLNEFGIHARTELFRDPEIVIRHVNQTAKYSKAESSKDTNTGENIFESVVRNLDYKGQEGAVSYSIVLRCLKNIKRNGNLSSPIVTNPQDERFFFSILHEIIKDKYIKLHGKAFNTKMNELFGNSIAIQSEINQAMSIINSASAASGAKIRTTNWYKSKFGIGFTENSEPIPEGSAAGPVYISDSDDFRLEKEISENLVRLMGSGKQSVDPNFKIPESLGLYDAQKNAVSQSLEYKISVITGGPGVGKTYVLSAVLDSILSSSQKKPKVIMAAPTGKAATRIKESTNNGKNSEFVKEIGRTANTIDSIIGIDTNKNSKYNSLNKLPVDIMIIDESSMVDAFKFNLLLKALPDHARLIILGDKDQLPSVDGGAVLEEMIKSKRIPFVILNETKRQGKGSDIVSAAYTIIDNKIPNLKGPQDENVNDLVFIETDSDNDTELEIKRLISHQITRVDNIPIENVQIVTYRRIAGEKLSAESSNRKFSDDFNPKRSNPNNKIGDTGYYVGDRVLCTKNNQKTGVMNGNQGVILYPKANTVAIQFTHLDKPVYVPMNELSSRNSNEVCFTLGNCITTHASQGSEYPVVIIPLSKEDTGNLTAQILYTAITRGKSKVYLVGSKDVLVNAVQRKQESKRDGTLSMLLKSMLPTLPSHCVNDKVKIILGQDDDNTMNNQTLSQDIQKSDMNTKKREYDFGEKVPF